MGKRLDLATESPEHRERRLRLMRENRARKKNPPPMRNFDSEGLMRILAK
jgi:hypothetical protein